MTPEDRAHAMDMAWKGAEVKAAVCGISREDFEDFYRTWDIRPVFAHGLIVGACMIHGNEIHMAVAPEYQRRFNLRKAIHTILRPLLDKYGECVTSTLFEDEARFVKRFGFSPNGRTGALTWWRLRRQDYAFS